MVDINFCTEKTRRWPQALAYVTSEEMEEFLAHAETCPYHKEILRAEDEWFRSVFRQAGGLDSAGRILTGEELNGAIRDNERRLALWKETQDESTFRHIALYNGGKEIASSGKFFSCPKHISVHELDARAGIQIRGIRSSSSAEYTLLGFYALEGVRHHDKEELKELDNGYTVGLRVKRLGERNFEIHFRCTETEIIRQEQKEHELLSVISDTDAGTGNNGPSLYPPPAHSVPFESEFWKHTPSNFHSYALGTFGAVVMVGLLAWAGWKAVQGSFCQCGGSNNVAVTILKSPDEGREASNSNNQGQEAVAPSLPDSPQASAPIRKRDETLPDNLSKSVKEALLGNQARRQPTPPAAPETSGTTANSAQARSYSNEVYVRDWELVSHGRLHSINDQSLAHIGKSENLKEELKQVMREIGVFVEQKDPERITSARPAITIQWSATIKEDELRKLFFVNVETVVKSKGRKSVVASNYAGKGDSRKSAYEDAIKKALCDLSSLINQPGKFTAACPAGSSQASKNTGSTLLDPDSPFVLGINNEQMAYSNDIEQIVAADLPLTK